MLCVSVKPPLFEHVMVTWLACHGDMVRGNMFLIARSLMKPGPGYSNLPTDVW